jgi:Tol biopolymer transport system component
MRRNLVRLLALAAPSFCTLVSCVALSGCGGGGNGPSVGPVVALLGDLDVNDHDELYVCDADGGNRKKVSGATGVGDGVSRFAWSPDHERLAFLDDKAVAGEHDVYVVTPDGSAPVLVSGPHVMSFDIHEFEWSPDSTRLLLGGSTGFFFPHVLATVPAAGGPLKILTLPGDTPTYSGVWWWSPDSTAVAFFAKDAVDDANGMYVAAADGSSTKLVSGSIVSGGSVDGWLPSNAWSADGTRVIYRGNKYDVNKTELFTSKRDGTGITKISHTLAAGGVVSIYAWSPVGSKVAYEASDAAAPSGRLYVVDGAGGAVTQVSENVGGVSALAWRPDGSGIAYVKFDSGGSLRLGDPIAGTSTSLATLSGADVTIDFDLAWSPDGSRVAYRTGLFSGTASSQYSRLFCVAPGSAPVLCSTSVVEGSGFVPRDGWQWSANSQRLGFCAQTVRYGPHAAYLSPVAGGNIRVSASGVNIGDHDIQWASDGSRLVWQEGLGTGTDRLVAIGNSSANPLVDSTPVFTDIWAFATR